jgi:cardiolipin synthase
VLLLALAHAHAQDPAAAASPDPCAAWTDPAFDRRLDRRTHSEARTGNATRLLVDGAVSWARRKELAATADVILVKTFIWSDDEVGREAADLLAARARAGATVIVQYDFKGSTPSASWVDAWRAGPRAWVHTTEPFRRMADAGVTVIPTGFPGGPPRRTVARVTNYDHEKYWLTGARQPDGTLLYTAITGGMNIASEYMYGGTDRVDAGSGRGGWRDTDVELRGPVVEDIVHRYFAVLTGELPTPVAELDTSTFTSPQPVAGDARVRFVWAHPVAGRRETIEHLYRDLIRATPDADPIAVETAYFAPTPGTWRALRRAARGRPLYVLTNSGGSVDVPFIASAAEAAFAGLRRVSPDARFFLWKPRPGFQTLHSKVATFGHCGPVIVGSANLDGLSALHNSEAVVAIEDPGLREELEAALLADMAEERADPATDAAWEEKLFLARWWASTVYAVGWYWL